MGKAWLGQCGIEQSSEVATPGAMSSATHSAQRGGLQHPSGQTTELVEVNYSPDPHRQAVMSQAVALRNARAEGYEVARAAAFVTHAMHPSKTTPIIDHNGVCICERCQSSSSKSEGAVGRLATLQGDVQRLQQMLEGHPTAPHEVGRSWLSSAQ